MIFLNTKKNASILSILICLTILLIAGQIAFFIIHYQVSDLFDSLVQSSLREQMLHPIILLPLIGFIAIQLIAYALFISWTWFVSVSISEFTALSRPSTFWLSLFIWNMNCGVILSLNNYYFPNSFFATLIPTTPILLCIFIMGFALSSLIAYLNVLMKRRHLMLASFFVLLFGITGCFSLFTQYFSNLTHFSKRQNAKPNIILIGVDSVRPDFVSYFNSKALPTPAMDSFLKEAAVFTQSYTPLARTFTSWMSILTAQHPKHNNARSNLADPSLIHADETLAKTLQAQGYETIYATDEKRFSNITQRYGFDRLLGPHIGITDFILGGLNDFPLTNLMINTALGSVIFPYNYANRAAAITYEPDKFLQQVKLGLANRSHQPLFLAIHLCLSHWPFTWARDNQLATATMSQKYQSSVSAVDQQLAQLMQMLKDNGLLEHSIVVLLSDHGTTVGLPQDRIISKNNYKGDLKKLHSLLIYRLDSANEYSFDFKHDYTLNTSYGQGTDVLSLKQYHIVLAFKGFGLTLPHRQISHPATLMDITPTLLSLLNLKPLSHTDGESLQPYLATALSPKAKLKPIFIETGHSIAEIETNDIFINKVVRNTIGIYQINPLTGQLSIKPAAEKSITRSKQRAILLGDWLLARYPATTRSKLVRDIKSSAKLSLDNWVFKKYTLPAFFVIVNLKSKQWSIGLDSAIAKQAPLALLMQKFKEFYTEELEPEQFEQA